MKPMGSVRRRYKSSDFWTKDMNENDQVQYFAICLSNKDCDDLEKRKIYRIIPDQEAAMEGYLRVIDESGEDYLYPESYFVIVELPLEAQEALSLG
jgi:hypothetical protein